MKFKKVITMGVAAIMAVSAMSISAFAEEDTLIATVPDEENNLIEVHESDLVNGEYSVECNGITITIGEKKTERMGISTYASSTFKYTKPVAREGISGTTKQNLTFSVGKNMTAYTPAQYTPAPGRTSLCYTFFPDESYGSKVTATVYLLDNNNSTLPVDLYNTEGHTVDISGMTNGDFTYASVKNSRYSGSATGTCTITN